MDCDVRITVCDCFDLVEIDKHALKIGKFENKYVENYVLFLSLRELYLRSFFSPLFIKILDDWS